MSNIHNSDKKIDITTDLFKYLNIIYHKKYLFLCIFILVSVIFTVYTYTIKEKFKSSATLLVEREKIINPLMRGLAISMTAAERLTTIRQLVLSRSRLLQVIKKLDLDLHVNTPLEMKKLLETMRNSIKISIIGKNLYTISYESENPKVVQDVTNTICNLFIEENLGASRSDAYDAFNFIEEQLNVYKEKLEKSENSLRLFKEKYLGQEAGERNINLQKLEYYKDSLSKAREGLQEARLQKSIIEKQLSREKPLILAFSTANNDPSSNSDALETQLAQLNSKLSFLLTKYTEKYPEIISLKEQIDKVKRKINEKNSLKPNQKNRENSETKTVTEALNPFYHQLREDLGEIKIKEKVLESRIKIYNENMELYEDKVKSIPKQEQELAQLKRGYDVNVQIYQTLLNKLEEARISRELDSEEKRATFQIIDAAELPLLPNKPNKPLLIILGLVIGLLSGFTVIYFLHYFDHSIINPDDARNYFGYPVLASIPNIITNEEIKKKRRSHIIFFSTAGVYIFSILIILVIEVINKYIIL